MNAGRSTRRELGANDGRRRWRRGRGEIRLAPLKIDSQRRLGRDRIDGLTEPLHSSIHCEIASSSPKYLSVASRTTDSALSPIGCQSRQPSIAQCRMRGQSARSF